MAPSFAVLPGVLMYVLYMRELTVWIVFPTVAICMYSSSPLVPLDSCLTVAACLSSACYRMFIYCVKSQWFPNQKFSWEHSRIKGLQCHGLQCHVRFLWDWPTHYRGLMSGICRFYWGKLPTMRPTIYCCLWWDNPTSNPNNVGTPHALPRSFPTIYPGYIDGVFYRKSIIIFK